MNIPFDANGHFAFKSPRSRAGDYVELRAAMDVLAIICNCPPVLNPANNFNPTPIGLLRFSNS